MDQVALERARHLGYLTGGWVPKGWRTDEGPAPRLADYGCQEHWSPSYGPRTDRNTWEAEGIVWFGEQSPGYRRTLAGYRRALRAHPVWWIENPTVSDLQEFILRHHVRRLMVAGNRQRINPKAAELAYVVLTAGLLPF